MQEIKRLLQPDAGFSGEVGLWIAALDDVRRQTKAAVEGLTPEELAWKPPLKGNSIGQLLRHIALVELDWILTDLCQLRLDRLPAEAPAMLHLDGPHADPGLRPVGDFFAVLDYARAETKRRVAPLKESDLAALREYRDETTHKTFSVRWILHHLVDHEAQHKGQLLAVKRMLVESVKAGQAIASS